MWIRNRPIIRTILMNFFSWKKLLFITCRIQVPTKNKPSVCAHTIQFFPFKHSQSHGNTTFQAQTPNTVTVTVTHANGETLLYPLPFLHSNNFVRYDPSRPLHVMDSPRTPFPFLPSNVRHRHVSHHHSNRGINCIVSS